VEVAVRLRLAVLLGVAVLFFWQLGGRDLWAPDEPYFAEGAREMVVDGHWAVPHVNGVITTDKPPLFFWLIALFSLPLGAVTSWTARLPSALAGLATVALTMRLGSRWYGRRTAALAGVLLSTTFMFWQKARWSQTDALLCCWIWIALSAFEAFRSGSSDGRRAGLLFWLAVALAVLTKGPVGLLLPLGIAFTVLLWDRDPGRWRQFAPVAGPVLFAVVIAAWVVLTEVGEPGDYSVWGALREHFIDRGLHGLHHKRPPWYFLEVLPSNLMPWTGLIPGALLLAWRRRLPGDRMALAAALFVLVFFSISTEKRELYALPALPAFALMMATLVASVSGWTEPLETGGRGVDARWVRLGHGVVGGVLLIVAVGLGVAAHLRDEVPYAGALWLAGILGVTSLGTLHLLRRDRKLAAVAMTAAGVAVAFLATETVISPTLEWRKSARPFAGRIREVTAESRARGMPVVAYRLSNLPEPFAFYSDGVYTLETDDAAELGRHLGRREQVFAVVNGDELTPLPRELRDRLSVVDSTRLARRNVLLVANHPYPGATPLPAEPPAPPP